MLLVVFYGCYGKKNSNKHLDLKRMKSATLSSDPARLGTSALHGPARGPYCSGSTIFYKKWDTWLRQAKQRTRATFL